MIINVASFSTLPFVSQRDMNNVCMAIAAIDTKKKNIRAKIYSRGFTELVQQKGTMNR